MKDSTKRFALGTAVAGLAGLVTGILTAPKSGKETRQDIKELTTRSINEAEKHLKRAHTDLNDAMDDAKDRMSELRGRARLQLEDAMEDSKSAKEKVRDVLSSIHEGQAKDRDLNKALRDASKALSHLKTFLAK